MSELQSTLADRGSRLGARIIDNVLYAGSAFVVFWLAGGSLDGESADLAFGLMMIPILLLFIVNIYLLAKSGQTIGKKIVSIKIVRNDSERVGLGRLVFLRMLAPSVLGAIPLVGPLFSLVNVLFIFREDRRCLHDLMADTKVVDR